MTTWRKMQPWDALPVFSLMREFYDRRIGTGDVTDAQLWDSLERCVGDYPHLEGFVVFEDQTLAGYAMLSRTYDPTQCCEALLLQEFYVDRPFRQTGCGDRFLRALPTLCPDCGYVTVSDTAGESVWRPLGYRRSGNLYAAACRPADAKEQPHS